MSREIKFRAWDVRTNQFGDFDGLVLYGPPAEQFTGLHDKHGKEIYEGDIIKNEWHSIKGDFIGDVWEVKFGQYDDSDLEWGSPAIGFYCESSAGEQQSPLNLACDEEEGIEIIGNIHERDGEAFHGK